MQLKNSRDKWGSRYPLGGRKVLYYLRMLVKYQNNHCDTIYGQSASKTIVLSSN